MRHYELLLDEYIAANGKHFNESLAKRVVDAMWHYDANKNKIEGEAVTVQDAQVLLSGMTEEKMKKCKWDAYVAANAFMHDLGKSAMPKSDILQVAKYFWFHDDDMDECHKVFWYFFR